MPNITKLTEQYIKEHPSIKDSLKKGLINYSSFTRLLCNDKSLNLKENFDAVLIAARRYKHKIAKEAVLEDAIIDILKKSKIEIKNKMYVVVMEKSIYFDSLIDIEKKIKKNSDEINVIESSNGMTVITSMEYKKDFEEKFKKKIIEDTKDVALITIKSPKQIETTPGVLPYLYSMFGENGINIIETMSCWTDTLFVVEEKNIAKIMELMKF